MAFDPGGWHNLVAIDPQGGRGVADARTFPPGSRDAIAAWVNEHAGRRNVYFTSNEVRPDFGHAKPGKADIARIRAIFADLDPPGGEDPEAWRAERLQRMRSDPTIAGAAIVDSGGGLQVFLPLAEKLPATVEVVRRAEALGLTLAAAVGGGDHVQNVDRLMRLPGPDNIPDAGKQAKGRVKRAAEVRDPIAQRFTLDEIDARLPQHPAGATPPTARDDQEQRIDEARRDLSCFCPDPFSDSVNLPAELPEGLRERFERDLAAKPWLAALWDEGEKSGPDKSHSGCRASLATALHQLDGYSLEDYAHLVGAWPHGLNPRKSLTARELAREWVRMGDRLTVGRQPEDHFLPMVDDDDDPGGSEPPRSAVGGQRWLRAESFDEAVSKALSAGGKPLVKGLLDQGAMSVFYGPSNVGKTFVAMDLAFQVALGRPWLGRATTKAAVLYVAAEGGGGVRKRLAALARREPTGCKPELHLVPECIGIEEDAGSLIDLAQSVGAGLIVIDTLARVMMGDENSAADMGRVIRCFDRVREETGAHVLIVHHTGKDASKGARGHSSLRAAVDTEAEVGEGALTWTKQKDHEIGGPSTFRLDGVFLGLDEEGDPVRSAVVSWDDPSASSASRAPTPTEDAVLAALAQVGAEVGEASAAQIATAVARAGGSMSPANARANLGRLLKKGLVIKRPGGMWASKQAERRGNAVLRFLSPFDPTGEFRGSPPATAAEKRTISLCALNPEASSQEAPEVASAQRGAQDAFG